MGGHSEILYELQLRVAMKPEIAELICIKLPGNNDDIMIRIPHDLGEKISVLLAGSGNMKYATVRGPIEGTKLANHSQLAEKKTVHTTLDLATRS